MKKDSYIGVFDSGIGGLTVVKSMMEAMPQESIIYFGDTAHVPYGTRSKKQITEYVLNDVAFLNTYDLKAVVIACNTADSVAKSAVQKAYPALPVYGVVAPAAKVAVETTKNKKVGVIATPATIRSRSYRDTIRALDPDVEVLGKACPLLVPLVENGRFLPGDAVVESVLKDYLNPLVEAGIDTLVLGCTHYPLLQDTIAQLYPKLQLISSSNAAVASLAEGLAETDLLSEGKKGEHRFFVSDRAENFEAQARIFMGDDFREVVEQVNLDE